MNTAEPGMVEDLPFLLAGRTVGRPEHGWVIAGAHPIYHRFTGDVTLLLTLRDASMREITITAGFELGTFDAKHFGDPDWIIEELAPQPLGHGEHYAIA